MSDKETAPRIDLEREVHEYLLSKGRTMPDDDYAMFEDGWIAARTFAVECTAPAPQPDDRTKVLLRACYDMLKKQRASGCAISPFETTVHYDEADCDGYCLMEDIEIELAAATPQVTPTKPTITLEVYQHDWLPGFAAFHSDGERAEGATKHIVLNLGSLLCAVESGDLPKQDLPYMIAESLMHETVHALEEWAGVEFSEERVEELLTKYREKYARATIWEYTGSEPKEPGPVEGKSEQAPQVTPCDHFWRTVAVNPKWSWFTECEKCTIGAPLELQAENCVEGTSEQASPTPEKSAKLCYVESGVAYFTTQELDKQWGDDWNDAPYEHNAGTPYGPYRPGDNWTITEIRFAGDFQVPCDGHCNSPWSVQQINKGFCPWLRTHQNCIMAGATVEEFCNFVTANDGCAAAPKSRNTGISLDGGKTIHSKFRND
jgi:hypothetical protein